MRRPGPASPGDPPPRRPRARERPRRTRTRTPARASGRSSGSSAPARWGRRSASRCRGPAGRWARSRRATRPGASGSASSSRASGPSPRPNALVDDVELVMLAVPDDVVAPLARGLRLYAGQAIVHTSGLLGAEVLAAGAGGRDAGGRVPPAGRVRRPRPGARGARRRDDRDRGRRRARGAPRRHGRGDRRPSRSGSRRARRPPTTRRRCSRRAASSALLDTIREIAAAMGLDEAGALRIYLPLLEQTVANARALGVARALTGPGDPRRRGDGGRPPRRARGRRARRAARLPGAARRASVIIAEGRGALAPEAAERLRTALAARPLTRYDADMQHSIVARHAAWPARYVHPATQGPGAAARPARRRRVHRGPGRRTVLRRPDVGPLTALRAPWRALVVAPARPVAQRPARGPRPRCSWTSSDRGRRTAALRPWRRRGAPEAGHRHLSGWHRHPVRRGGSRELVVGTPQPRARRGDLDPPQGHAQRRARPPRRRRSARCARRPGSTSASSGRFDCIEYCLRPGPDPDPQDRPLLPDGARRAATSTATTTSSTRCAGSGSTRRPRLLTFETERALVARAGVAATDGRFPGATRTRRRPPRDRVAADRPDRRPRCSTATRRSARGSSSSRAG